MVERPPPPGRMSPRDCFCEGVPARDSYKDSVWRGRARKRLIQGLFGEGLSRGGLFKGSVPRRSCRGGLLEETVLVVDLGAVIPGSVGGDCFGGQTVDPIVRLDCF